jgi:hypothetical protein
VTIIGIRRPKSALRRVKLFVQTASVPNGHALYHPQQRLFLAVFLIGLGFLQIIEPDQEGDAVKFDFDRVNSNRSERLSGLSYDGFSAPDFAGICSGGENFQSKVVGHGIPLGSIAPSGPSKKMTLWRCVVKSTEKAVRVIGVSMGASWTKNYPAVTDRLALSYKNSTES